MYVYVIYNVHIKSVWERVIIIYLTMCGRGFERTSDLGGAPSNSVSYLHVCMPMMVVV